MQEDIERFTRAARSALGAWGLQTAELSLIKYRENAVFRVSLEGRAAYVLRVHRQGYHADAVIESELAWMGMLAREGTATPAVIPTQAGDLLAIVMQGTPPTRFQCDLLSFVDGQPFGSADDRNYAPAEVLAQIYERTGRAAATIHRTSMQWQPPEGFTRPVWDAEGCLGRNALWGYYGDLASVQPGERESLDAAVQEAARQLARFGHSPQRFGLIHCDLVPDNLLMDADGELVVLDFDDCGRGWFMWELATALFWHLDTPAYATVASALLDGYAQVLPLEQAALDMLPCMLFMRGIVYLGWMHTRSNTPTARELTAHVLAQTLALGQQLLAGNTDVMTPLPFALPAPTPSAVAAAHP